MRASLRSGLHLAILLGIATHVGLRGQLAASDIWVGNGPRAGSSTRWSSTHLTRARSTPNDLGWSLQECRQRRELESIKPRSHG